MSDTPSEQTSTPSGDTPTQEQPQTDKGYESVSLGIRHLPADNSGPFNTIAEAQAAGHDTLNPTTGVVQVGVIHEGQFVPIIEDAAARFFHLRDAEKLRKENEQA